MSNKFPNKIDAYFRGMSSRERRLALAVAALVALMLCLSVIRGSYGYVQHLDATIDRLQEDIVNYKYSIAHRQEVEALYARVAKQHSSKWSEAEIHDRLRQEIYRLAQMVPPALDENGVPAQISASGGSLVDIPTLRQGVLLDGGVDFRQYQLGFRIDNAEFANVVAFVERLQNSPQSLRIDDMVLARSPDSSRVSVRMEITRTVVSGENTVLPVESEEDLWASEKHDLPLRPETWFPEECALNAVEGKTPEEASALQAVAENNGAAVSFLSDMDLGASYDMFVEIAAYSECQLGVSGQNGQHIFDAPYDLPADGKAYRYHIRFSVPGELGQKAQFRTPQLVFSAAEGKAVINRLIIKKAVG